MANLTIRNVPPATHRALQARAKAAHRSVEAEVRSILESQARPDTRPLLGSLLREIGQQAGGMELDALRDPTSSDPVDLS
jgi:plasmid stability protein